MSGVHSSLVTPAATITQADLFARACTALGAGQPDSVAGLALEARSRTPSPAEVAAWSALLSAAAGCLADAQEAVMRAVALDGGNEAIRHVRLNVMRAVATRRVEEQKAMARERRSIFARMRRD